MPLIKPLPSSFLLGKLLFTCALGSYLAAAQAAPLPREVIIVFKTHFDIGYTEMASNVVQRYRTSMIDQALKVVEQNRDLPPEQQFAWTIPGWPMSKIAESWDGQSPERQQKIQQAFREGRFVVHALPFTTHTELLEPEDLARGLGYATRLANQAGLPLPRDAKMTDVPCHSSILPTLLRNSGVEFLHLGCNAASSSPRVPFLFWWEGPDGSRLLTMYSASGYGTGLQPPDEWPFKTWLALIHTGDNHGPPTPQEVQQLLDQAKIKLPGVKVRIGRLSDFAETVLAEDTPIPVIRGDMPDTWIHGPMCDPAGAKMARNIRPLLGAAESLHTLLGIWGVPLPDISTSLAQAYEQSLLYGEHTWGGALSWITSYGSDMTWAYGDSWKSNRAQGRFKRLESSWDEHSAYIKNARKIVEPILQKDLDTLARQVNVSQPHMVVFNALPWKRSGVVEIDGWSQGNIVALRPAEGGAEVPCAANGSNLQFWAQDVPSLGYRSYVAVTRSEAASTSSMLVDATRGQVENRWFKLTIDADRGIVRSLRDKRTGREWIDPSSRQGFGQYLYERFDSNQVAAYVKAYVKISDAWATNELGKPKLPPASQVPYRAFSPARGSLIFEQTPFAVSATWHAGSSSELNHGITTRIRLFENAPFLDLEVTVHDKPADPWPEAGWICLPLKIDSPQFRLGRPGAIIDPAQDIVRGANRHLFGIHTGVALFDAQGRGGALCAPDSPLLSLDEPGCWKYSLDFVPSKPVVYVNLFNNQWTTNFRLWNSGTWTARVRFWPFQEFDPESSLITPSLETRYPLLGAMAEGTPGKLPPAQSGLEISSPGSLLTAFAPNPNGEGLLLRLWELCGKSGARQVRLPATLVSGRVHPVDLRGTPCGFPLDIKEKEFQAQLPGFAPASFILTPSP